MVKVLLRGPAGYVGEFLLAFEVLLGEGESRFRFVELGLNRSDFRRTAAFLGIVKAGAGLRQLFNSLIVRCFFGGVVESEKAIASSNLGSTLHREGLDSASERRGDIDKFPLHVALHRARRRLIATGKKRSHGDSDKSVREQMQPRFKN